MKPRPCFTTRIALPSLILLAALGLSSAHAASDTWIQTVAATYNWNDGLNWLSNTQFPNGAAQTANLNNDIAGAQTVNLNVPIALGTLNIGDASGVSVLTLAAGTSGSLTFNNGLSNSVIINQGGANSISSGIQLNGNLAITTTTALNLSGPLSGYGGLIKTGANKLTLSHNTQSFSGNVSIAEGTLAIDLGARTLPSTASIDIALGATFDGSQTNGNIRTFSGLTGAGTFTQTFGGGKTITINNALNNVFSGTIIYGNSGTNSNTLTKSSIGSFTLGGAGAWTVGTSSSTTLILNGGKFILDSSGTNHNNRITDTVKLALGGGDFQIFGNASAPTTETIAAHTLSPSRAGRITLNSDPSQSVTLTLASLTQTAGSTSGNARTCPGGILYRGSNLGVNEPGTINSTNVLYATTAPTLFGGGGAAGTSTISILNYALGDTSATGFGSGLVTYHATKGVRLLDTATECAVLVDGTTTLENAKLAAGTAVASSTTVNSLLVQGSGSSAITGTLAITCGALVFDTTTTAALTGTIRVGNAAAADANAYVSVIDANGVVTLPGITYGTTAGSFSLIKQGAGTLVLTGQAGSSAGYVVAAGTLKAGAVNTLARGGASIGESLRIQGGATADMAGFNQTPGSDGYISIETGGTLTNSGNNATFAVHGSNTSATATINGNITDGTPGDGATSGLVSITSAATDSKTTNITHGGHTLNSITVSSGSNTNTNTMNLTSLTETDHNTVYGAVSLGKGGKLNVTTIYNGSNIAKTLDAAPIGIGNAGGNTGAAVATLTVNSKGSTGNITGATLTWTNDITVGSGQSNGDLIVGSGDGGLSTGVTQQFGALTISDNAKTGVRTFQSTSNNGYTTEFTGATTLAGGAAVTHVVGVLAGTLVLQAVGESGTGAKGLTKTGIGTLLIKGAASHTGATTISAGTLKLGADATITGTPSVTLASGATFDVSALIGPYSIAFGKTLAGSGSVAGSAEVAGTVAPGDTISGTLTTTGNLTISGIMDIDVVGAAQVETATAVGTVNGTGGIVNVTVTSAGIIGSPLTIPVTLTAGDIPATWATTVRTALSDNTAIAALYAVGGTGATITLTRKSGAPNDSTLNIALDNDVTSSPGITPALTSVDTTAGLGPSTDVLAVGGVLDISGSTLDVSANGTLTAPAYVIATYDTLVGSFASIGTLPDGYTLNYAYNNGINSKNIALVPPSGTSTYEGWASTNGVSGGVNGDSDKDGIPNGMEYALDTNPAGSDASPGTYNGTLLSFNKRTLTSGNADLMNGYRIEVSPDLGVTPWVEVAPYVTNTSSVISANVPTGPLKNFARLRVVIATP